MLSAVPPTGPQLAVEAPARTGVMGACHRLGGGRQAARPAGVVLPQRAETPPAQTLQFYFVFTIM
jgi:hypothetical protein